MKAREIIYHHYSDKHTRKLEQQIKALYKAGDTFEAGVIELKLNRYQLAAHSDIVNHQVQGTLRATLRSTEKEIGRQRLTLREINRLRKLKYKLIRDETSRLANIENMYGQQNN